MLLLYNEKTSSQNSNPYIARESNLLVVKHYSKILNKEKTFRIYLPESFEGNNLFPVLYVLHGVLCNSDAWPAQTEIENLAVDYKMMLVFPDGENSWYINSPIKPYMQYESYIINELIPFIERTFPARNDRYGRAIMGASMGGHGAITLAEKYPDLFCSVSSFFGILKLTEKITINSNLVGPYLNELLGPYDFNQKLWEANSAYELAENFLNKDIAIFIDCGEDDETPAILTGREFHQRLTDLEIPHTWKEKEGAHTKEFLNENLREHLDFHWKIFVNNTN